MKNYEDFTRSGHTFADRLGEPTEIDAAMGRIALAFSLLEDSVSELVYLLVGTDGTVSALITAELSFRQRLDLFGSLARHRIGSDGSSEVLERLGEILQMCRRAAELRNTYMHSSYSRDQRTKTTAKGAQGLRVRVEPIDSALLLDVADFISETALMCQGVPVDLGIADSSSAVDDTITYTRSGLVVGTSRRL